MWRVLALLSLIGISTADLAAQANDQTTKTGGAILVFPFAIPAGATGQWIGRGAQEDLITDLTQATLAKIKAPPEPFPARDQAAALKQARDLDATIVIYGQAQVVDLNVRLTGQVVDVASERVLGAIKVTGPLNELFPLEDLLAREVFAALPQEMLKPEVLQYLRDTSSPQPPPSDAPEDPSQLGPLVPQVNSVAPGPIVYEPEVPPYGPSVQTVSPSLGWDPSLGWNDVYGLGPYAGWWGPPGTIVITSLGSSGHHRDSHHGHGRWDGGGQQTAAAGSTNQVAAAGTSDPVAVRFTWGGVAGQAAGGGAPMQSSPRGFSGHGSSGGGFTTMSGAHFGNRGFHSISGFGGGLGFTGQGGAVRR